MSHIKIPNFVNVKWAEQEMTRVYKKTCNKDFVFYVMRGEKFNNRIDWIDLSELPKLKKGSNEAIDWNLVKGYNTYANYSGYVGST